MNKGDGHIVHNLDAQKIMNFHDNGVSNHLHLLVKAGSVDVTLYGSEKRTLAEGDYLDAARIGTVSFCNPSHGFAATLLTVKRSEIPLYMESLPRMPLNMYLIFSNISVLHLNKAEFAMMDHAFQEIEKIDYSNHRYRQLMLVKAFQMFVMDLVHIVERSAERIPEVEGKVSGSMLRLFNEFAEEVRISGSRQHSVGYYSGKLKISSQYLNKVAKALTGETASCFIRKYLITNISYELVNSGKNAKQIAYDYNFSCMSAFSNFVKHNLGQTVTELLQGNKA